MIKLENITSLFMPLCKIIFRILKYKYKLQEDNNKVEDT